MENQITWWGAGPRCSFLLSGSFCWPVVTVSLADLFFLRCCHSKKIYSIFLISFFLEGAQDSLFPSWKRERKKEASCFRGLYPFSSKGEAGREKWGVVMGRREKEGTKDGEKEKKNRKERKGGGGGKRRMKSRN